MQALTLFDSTSIKQLTVYANVVDMCYNFFSGGTYYVPFSSGDTAKIKQNTPGLVAAFMTAEYIMHQDPYHVSFKDAVTQIANNKSQDASVQYMSAAFANTTWRVQSIYRDRAQNHPFSSPFHAIEMNGPELAKDRIQVRCCAFLLLDFVRGGNQMSLPEWNPLTNGRHVTIDDFPVSMQPFITHVQRSINGGSGKRIKPKASKASKGAAWSATGNHVAVKGSRRPKAVYRNAATGELRVRSVRTAPDGSRKTSYVKF